MQPLWDFVRFCGDYLTTVFWSWWSLAFVLFGLNEMSEWLFRKSLRWIHQKRVLVVVLLVLVAQAVAYKELSDKYREFVTQQKSAPAAAQVPYAISTDEREWPPLTGDEIAAWTKALAPFHLSEIKVFWGQDVAARRLFHSLQEVGKGMQCSVVIGAGYTDTPEIGISTGNDDSLGLVLVKLFKDYLKGLNCPVTSGPSGGEGISKNIAIYLPDSPPWPQSHPSQTENVKRDAIAERAARKEIVEGLIKFRAQGHRILDNCAKVRLGARDEFTAWSDAVIDFLMAKDGAAAVVGFTKDREMIDRMPQSWAPDILKDSFDEEHALYNGIRKKLQNIEDLIAEYSKRP